MMLCIALALFAVGLQAVIIPGPPGPHSVSYQVHDLTDQTRWDPYAPSDSPHKRRILISSFSPLALGDNCTSTLVDYMPPQTTIAYGAYAADNGLPEALFEDIRINFCQPSACHGTKHQKYPLVVFSPGLSASRLLYTLQAKALASYGFVVVTIDHPYDATFVEFPDGSSVRGTVGYSDGESDLATEVRAQDVSFVIDLFQNLNSNNHLIPSKITNKADLRKIFVYGHSLGGATAAEATLNDDRVLGGIDLDGSPWARSKAVGLDKPFLMSGKGTANGIDETWAPFYEKLRGPKMQVRVEGATHYSYIDMPILLAARPLPAEYDDLVKLLVGTVEGKQMEKIVMSLLLGLAKLVLEDDSGPLLKLKDAFPEITVVAADLS
ncbi:unnamed protein product [Clonostachys rosea f. rosea IK726]|uniref:Uncharacterized protein n=1 Tax=Clonostachys rosea f. rosea IK726 TaxID=1349383 RepID=A0ACA9UQK5_BIOOC|nr:unnamed protein product [Clonostachys rosea f. rosea IK726]